LFLFFVSIAYISNLVPIGVLCQIVTCFRQIVNYSIFEKGGERGWKRTFQCSVLLVFTAYKCTDINK